MRVEVQLGICRRNHNDNDQWRVYKYKLRHFSKGDGVTKTDKNNKVTGCKERNGNTFLNDFWTKF